LERWLTGLNVSYRDRIVGVDASIAEESGRINVPDPLPVVDGWLAASAIVRDWTLVTRNVRDVKRYGVRLQNPFEPRTED
jgi:toxin FitB